MEPTASGAGLGGAAPARLVPGTRWRKVLRGDERALRVLRQWLATLFASSPARDDLIAVATELGNNAVKHTASGDGGWFVVEVTALTSVVQVAVADGGALTEPHVIRDPLAESGRGLAVVQALSSQFGYLGDRHGRLVWAEVPWPEEAGVATAAEPDPNETAIHDGEVPLTRRLGNVHA